MHTQQLPYGNFPYQIESPSGLRVQVNANGSIRRIDYHDIMLNLFLGTEVEGGPANIFLRRRTRSIEAIPLIGPRSPAGIRVGKRSMTARGHWQGIDFRISLVLAEDAPAWFWHVALENTGSAAETVDLVYAQDLAISDYGAVRLNEYYVSHYIDHAPLSHPQTGWVVASRQNLSVGGRNPLTVIGSLTGGVSYATDALQVYGLLNRAGAGPLVFVQDLPGCRLQHEHSMVAIQDGAVELRPGAVAERGFFGWFEEHHPAASSDADLVFVDRALALPEAAPEADTDESLTASASPGLFSSAPLLESLELSDEETGGLFGGERHDEEYENGRLLSFFTGTNRHVVLKAKEGKVLRPHGHIMRTGSSLTPDETALTSTTWMAGVFHSMVTQGHVNINRFLSTTHSYLRLFCANGQRIFVELDDEWRLLDVPSAFSMEPNGCRWIYKHRAGIIQVRSSAPAESHVLTLAVEVLSGEPLRFLISNHVSINGDDGSTAVPVNYEEGHEGIFVRAVPDCDVGRRFPGGGFRIAFLPGTVIEAIGRDELLFADGCSRNQSYLCMVTAPALAAGLQIYGCLIEAREDMPASTATERVLNDAEPVLSVAPPPDSPLGGALSRFAAILPWYIQNAFVHYLAPRGLEQYSGGGWGVRDVCQGPVELLLALGHCEPVRDLLLRVFRTQNPDGDWPQWFMFFERERAIRPGDSHGDIVFWPLLALAQYLIACGDASVLEEEVVFFHPQGDQQAERGTLWQHVERALAVISARVIRGTRLAAYGNGDWNDSLQPVQPAMRERLCSSWTVTLHYQTLTALTAALRGLGRADAAARCETMAAGVLDEFRRLLLVDDVLAGFAFFHEDGTVEYLLHPRDRTTGLSYSLLPMIHAIINDLLTPEQARRHLQIIREHLLGPDGARLFDRPVKYGGGPQRYFQRAESTSFFGRENGLMYMHTHLRYAEALAHYGDADGFFRALCHANPVGMKALVPPAALRQANCYYSSSDAAFTDRYQAYAEYEKVMKGEVPLEGGWRVYSSGAGIATGLIMRCLFGFRREKSELVVDPVMPPALDGARARLRLMECLFEVTYHSAGAGCGPAKVILNGADLRFTRGNNPYRTGAARIPLEEIRKHLTAEVNRLEVYLG